MSRPNIVMSHLPPDDEISVKMFNHYVKKNDTKGTCDELAKTFNECVKHHKGDFRFCGTSYFKLVKCVHLIKN
jgi:hypothetical protein